SGALKGKVSYMSPEQAEGLAIDGRSDIFALGVVFYEMLTQRRLFRADTVLERLRLVREARVVAPSQLTRALTPDIDAVALRMLARQTADRYQSCEQVVAALTPIAHRLVGHGGALRQLVSELEPYFEPKKSSAVGPDDGRCATGVASVGIAPQ